MKTRAAAERATILPEITSLRAAGLSTRTIADRVGVSAMTVSQLLRT